MKQREARDRGSGTILMLGVLAVIVAVLGGGLAVVSAVHASLHARTAADLAALAAESVLLAGTGSPCASAAHVASANGAEVTSCVPDGDTVTVSVTVSTGATRRLGLGPASARSRSGPSNPGPAAEPGVSAVRDDGGVQQ